jgi:hypothetical protein
MHTESPDRDHRSTDLTGPPPPHVRSPAIRMYQPLANASDKPSHLTAVLCPRDSLAECPGSLSKTGVPPHVMTPDSAYRPSM